MIKKVVNYIKNNEFQFKYINNKLNVINYDKIILLESNIITIKYQNKVLIVRGDNLILNKLLEQEILVTGIIKSIEM